MVVVPIHAIHPVSAGHVIAFDDSHRAIQSAVSAVAKVAIANVTPKHFHK